jgi:hypothetical protein
LTEGSGTSKSSRRRNRANSGARRGHWLAVRVGLLMTLVLIVSVAGGANASEASGRGPTLRSEGITAPEGWIIVEIDSDMEMIVDPTGHVAPVSVSRITMVPSASDGLQVSAGCSVTQSHTDPYLTYGNQGEKFANGKATVTISSGCSSGHSYLHRLEWAWNAYRERSFSVAPGQTKTSVVTMQCASSTVRTWKNKLALSGNWFSIKQKSLACST